ncbi:hypothetical protein A2U01_0004150 [Trifolium medium]|uniref:Uncharacterized protein n=1 Tax=Trifolium medium TaxID=97028 RepID=A0A392M7N2_9FABA|nr:hypothetical protein [Trifolium medium]
MGVSGTVVVVGTTAVSVAMPPELDLRAAGIWKIRTLVGVLEMMKAREKREGEERERKGKNDEI